MAKTWVIADPHFGHEGVCKFMAKDGVNKLRPWDSAKEMTEWMVNAWNESVNPQDRVYLLGDVEMRRSHVLDQLNGRIVLVKGNHDQDKLSYYSQYFDDIRAYVVKKGFIMSHIPIHPGSLGRWGLNIHGHLHDGVVKDENGKPDPRYRCVSAEHIGFRPMDLQKIIDEQNLLVE